MRLFQKVYKTVITSPGFPGRGNLLILKTKLKNNFRYTIPKMGDCFPACHAWEVQRRAGDLLMPNLRNDVYCKHLRQPLLNNKTLFNQS